MTRWTLAALLLTTGCLTWSEYEPRSTEDVDAGSSGDLGAVVPGEWWNADWPRRQRIELPATASPTERLQDFPLRVPLAHDGPIRFVAPDGELLPHQRDDAGFWVRVTIASDAPTTFYAYTGNEEATDGDSTEVWSNGYVAVFHFEEELIDEAAGFQPYFRDEIGELTIRQVEEFTGSGHSAGHFGRALHLTDDFETRFVSPELHTVFPDGAMTLELWHTVRPIPGTVRNIMSQFDGLAIEMREPGIEVSARGDQERSVGWEVESDVWTKMTLVLDEVSPRRVLRFYLGTESRESPPLPESWRPSQSEFYFGAPSTLDFRYDELRISNGARSDEWIVFAAQVEAKPSPVVVGEVENDE